MRCFWDDHKGFTLRRANSSTARFTWRQKRQNVFLQFLKLSDPRKHLLTRVSLQSNRFTQATILGFCKPLIANGLERDEWGCLSLYLPPCRPPDPQLEPDRCKLWKSLLRHLDTHWTLDLGILILERSDGDRCGQFNSWRRENLLRSLPSSRSSFRKRLLRRLFLSEQCCDWRRARAFKRSQARRHSRCRLSPRQRNSGSRPGP